MPADDKPLVALLVRAGGSYCALPLAAVEETMRPLPVEPVAGAPACVSGVAVIRGHALPVVDLASLLGAKEEEPPTRLISLRVDGRGVGLLVAAVEGVVYLSGSVETLPPLLEDAEAIAGLGARDGALLRLLAEARALPPEILALGEGEAAA